jgi:hypothetical protein
MSDDTVRDLDEGERVMTPDPRLTVLPDPAEVFDPEQPWLGRVLHPLVSVDLAAVDPGLSGRIHLLSPVEPESGLLGEETTRHHDDQVTENWISFHVDGDGRYRFLGDRRFFEIEDQEARGRVSASLAATYAQAQEQLAGTRVRYARLGALVWGDPADWTRQRDGASTDNALVDQLGGEPGHGNWTAFEPPAAFVLDQDDPVTPTLRLADGRPFRFVAATAGYPWRAQGADAILLFFEPETRTAVLTFDWS